MNSYDTWRRKQRRFAFWRAAAAWGVLLILGGFTCLGIWFAFTLLFAMAVR
jgi:hypothetical protein